MKKVLKLTVVVIFGALVLGLLINTAYSINGSRVYAQTEDSTPTPTPEVTPSAAASPEASPDTSPAEDKTIPKHFTFGLDSFSEYGAAEFNHDTHAFQKYSPDGQSVVGCAECHHTDQPKSALKPPLLTSERDELMTFESWKKSSQKVTSCRSCHFQDGDVPDGKEMPVAKYVVGDNETTKTLHNENAYHINCNTCHDAAFALRPELKQKKGFSTAKDCLICHVEN